MSHTYEEYVVDKTNYQCSTYSHAIWIRWYCCAYISMPDDAEQYHRIEVASKAGGGYGKHTLLTARSSRFYQ